MAFILRSTRLVYSLVRFSRQISSLTDQRRKIIFKNCRILNFNELKIRSAAVAAQTQLEQENYFNFEKSIYLLSLGIKRKQVSWNNFNYALEAVKQKGELSHSHLMLLLKCCSEISLTVSEEDRIKMAERIWQTATDLGTQFTISHYNALLEIFVINHHKFSPIQFLESLKNVDLEANYNTYRLLLKAYCSEGDIEGAQLVLNIMKELNFALKRQDFNSLIQGHCEIGDLEKATEILKIMEEREIEPLSDSYVYLLCGYAKHGRIDKLKEMFHEMSEKNIYFSDSELLEILYVLAINNHNQFMDIIIDKISKNEDYEKIVTQYIVRLLEKKKDLAALRLYETIDVGKRSAENILSHTKTLLKFLLIYREPKEILDICIKLEDKDCNQHALNYALSGCLRMKDENFCLDFIKAMSDRRIKIKKHYYWPIIIKASKKGNSAVLSILKNTLNKTLLQDYDSFMHIIIPNYKFDDNWKADFDKFLKISPNVKMLTRCFIEMFLVQKKIHDAEHLVSIYPVKLNNVNNLLQYLFKNIEDHPNEHEHIINILYYLAHDFKDQNDSDNRNVQDDGVEYNKFFSAAVKVLGNCSFKEEVNQKILEGMLEKKMGPIHPSVKDSLKNCSTGELLHRLEDPNLRFEADHNIIKNKNSYVQSSYEYDFLINSTLSSEEKKKNLLQKYESAPIDECVKFMLELAKRNCFEDAIELGEHLHHFGNEIQDVIGTKLLYLNFLSECNRKNKEPALLEKAYELGIKLGILQTKDFATVIRAYLRSNDPSKAVEKFCDYALSSGEFTGCVELLRKLIFLGNTECIDKVTNFISDLVSKDTSLSFLVMALLQLEEMDKAKKVLNTENFDFDQNVFRRNLEYLARFRNSEFFEKILKVFKDSQNFDRKLLYMTLIKKYLVEKRFDAIKELELQMKQDSTLDRKFLRKITNIIGNPDTQDFHKLSKTVASDSHSTSVPKNNTTKLFLHFMEKRDFEEAFNLIMTEDIPVSEAAKLLDALASEGRVPQVYEILSKPWFGRFIKRTAIEFVKARKVNEYFQFLSHFSAEGKINKISECLKIPYLLPALKEDDALLKTYKSFALQCLEDINDATPLISYFVACVKIPGKLEEAENIFKDYTDHFKKVPFRDITDIVKATGEPCDFYENLLSSEKLKPHFLENLSVFYNRVIGAKWKANKIDCAKHYLEMAVKDGVKEHLHKNLLMTLLDENLTEERNNISSENSKSASD